MRSVLPVLLALLLLPPPSSASAGDGPVPEGAVLSVSTGKPEFLLGERVVLRLKLTNSGSRPFTISPMVWQRFAVRDEFVEVAMVDAEGRAAWDPFPERMGGGGPSPPDITLAPGESWGEDLELWRYRVPDRAGSWTLRVTRDFSWDPTPARQIPSASATLRFREPTEAEAKGVLAGLESQEPRSRFHAAAHPVYVPLLEARAAAGLAEASDGLALNREPAATRALIRLLASKDRAVAARAGTHLVERIRVPRGGEPGERVRYRRATRGFLHADEDMAPFWLPEFEPAARAAARAFLAGEGVPAAGPAAEVLDLVGTAEDGPAVAAAIDRFAPEFEKETGAGDWRLEDARDRDEAALRAATWSLVERGFRAPSPPEGAGHAMFWLRALRAAEGKDRPAGWEETLQRLASHPRALVRREVAGIARSGMAGSPATARLIIERLAGDPDPRVREAAGAGR
ncbi:MAG: hypothetical protein L6R43_04110 [Planctomycetes bacterium]|nr:hypothetical protein [Planctomycetota bacterium]